MAGWQKRNWLKALVLVGAAVVALAGSAAAQLNLHSTVVNLIQADGRFRPTLFLKFAPYSTKSHQATLDIEFRVSVRNSDGLSVYKAELLKEYQHPEESGDSLVRWRRPLPLGPGLYDISVEVADLQSNRFQIHSMEHLVPSASERVRLSSIILAKPIEDEAGWPSEFQLEPRLKASAEVLPFFTDLHLPEPAALRYRAILYSRQSKNATPYADEYISTLKISRPLNLGRGRHQLADAFQLSGLSSGDYLIEVFLLDEDSIIVERSAKVYFEWQGLSQVWTSPERSIEKLRPIAGYNWVDSVLNASGGGYHNALKQFWAEYSEQHQVDARQAMTDYYQRVAAADTQFGTESLAGHKHPLGELYLQLGEPSERDTLPGAESTTVIWYYERYKLKLAYDYERGRLQTNI